MKTYCFKLYRSKRNKKLHKIINIAGLVYNHLVALHKRYYRMYGKHLNIYRLQKHITKLKTLPKYKRWRLLNSQTIQDITERIERSYRLFFENRKRGIKAKPPSFKRVKKYKSFTLKQCGYKLTEGNGIVIMGNVFKYSKSRDIEGCIKTLTVKRDALGDIYVYFACETHDSPVKSGTGKSVGFDFGLKKFLVSSNGEDDVESPLFYKCGVKKIRSLHKALSRKKQDSGNIERARLVLARRHKKIRNQRKDFHFKLAKRLSEKYGLICVETLNLKAMQRLWGRKISDLGHGQFMNILKHQCSKSGCAVIEIPAFHPSSKTCSNCGHVLAFLPLDVRQWTCPSCGEEHDRDKNAAKNILKVGASTFVGEGVRPAHAGVLQ